MHCVAHISELIPTDMERSRQKRSVRALVVDDEGLIADTLALILKNHDFAAEAVHSGFEAIARAKSEPFDVMISDVVMPEMNGIEAANEVRKILSECRIVLISGHPETARLLSDAREKGCDYEIHAKPVHPNILIGILEEVATARAD